MSEDEASRIEYTERNQSSEGLNRVIRLGDLIRDTTKRRPNINLQRKIRVRY